MAHPTVRYFEFGHLPAGELQETSAKFQELARWMDEALPDGSEKSTALRKLLEAKDCAVRSMARDKVRA